MSSQTFPGRADDKRNSREAVRHFGGPLAGARPYVSSRQKSRKNGRFNRKRRLDIVCDVPLIPREVQNTNNRRDGSWTSRVSWLQDQVFPQVNCRTRWVTRFWLLFRGTWGIMHLILYRKQLVGLGGRGGCTLKRRLNQLTLQCTGRR